MSTGLPSLAPFIMPPPMPLLPDPDAEPAAVFMAVLSVGDDFDFGDDLENADLAKRLGVAFAVGLSCSSVGFGIVAPLMENAGGALSPSFLEESLFFKDEVFSNANFGGELLFLGRESKNCEMDFSLGCGIIALVVGNGPVVACDGCAAAVPSAPLAEPFSEDSNDFGGVEVDEAGLLLVGEESNDGPLKLLSPP